MTSVELRPDSLRPGFYVIEDIRNLPDSAIGRGSLRAHAWRPPTDFYEIEDAYILRVEIAGMDEKDFNIGLDQNILTVQGARLDIPDRRAYHQMEINFGEFITAVELPGPIDVENVSAEYLNGFLVITFLKALPKHIPIHE